MSAMLPAVCTRCHRTFTPDHGISIENSTEITITGGGTACPYCGGFARWTEGTFNVGTDDILDILAGPAWSVAKIRRIRSTLLAAQPVAAVDPEEALARISAVDPVVGSALRAWWATWSRQDRMQALQLLVATLALLAMILVPLEVARRAEQGRVSETQVRQIVQEAIDEAARADVPGPQTEPSPAAPPPVAPAASSAGCATGTPPPAAQR